MNLLNKLRSSYQKAPEWMKSAVSPLLGLVPLRFRFGKLFFDTLNLIKRGNQDPHFVSSFQRLKLCELITVCSEKSEYYSNIIPKSMQSKINPSNIIDEFRYLPILKKEDIRGNEEKFCVVAPHLLDEVTTSGSSGRPLKFYLDKDRSPKEWAFINYLWSDIGYSPKDTRAVLRGTEKKLSRSNPWAFDPALKELRLSPFLLEPEIMDLYLELMDRFSIDYIHGYPSAISILAAHIKRKKWTARKPIRGVLPISENLLQSQRDLIKEVFPKIGIKPFYGLSEKVAIAGEIKHKPDYYAFEPLYGFTELVDEDNQPINEIGKKGRIISTGFLSKGMPLLRYDTGDKGILSEIPSEKNGYRISLSHIRSRWSQEFLVSNSGSLISISAVNIHSKNYESIREFQFFQDRPGTAKLRVIPMTDEQHHIHAFCRELQNKLGDTVELELEIVTNLKINKRGKRPFIEQKIDLSTL